uniref:Uncharacterized protein n=1 Tax=Glossina morsitans morsitans TaxID=37546 RepID=A0A1B0GDR9_GLOMM
MYGSLNFIYTTEIMNIYFAARKLPKKNIHLSPALNIRKMYSLYAEKCEENNQPFVNEWACRKVFNTEFIYISMLLKNTHAKNAIYLKGEIEACSNEEEKLHLRQSHELRLQSAERARNCLAVGQKKAKENLIISEICTYTTWVSLISIITILRRKCGMQPQLQDVHMKDAITQKHVLTSCDSCSGENHHKFLVSGHFFLPNEPEFGLMQMKMEKANYIYNPKRYYELIEKCRRRNTFSSTIRRVKNTGGESVSWLQIQWMNHYKIFFKTALDNSKFHVLNRSPKRIRPKIYEYIKLLLKLDLKNS